MNRRQYLLNCIIEGVEPDIKIENTEELYLARIAKKIASGGVK